MDCRSKEHVSKFNSKSEKIRSESAFYKHLLSSHGGKLDEKTFNDYFEIKILKAYQKPFTMLVEEGTFISSHKGELLNSKNEWHQAKIINHHHCCTRWRGSAARTRSRRKPTPGRCTRSKALGTVESFFKSKSLLLSFISAQKDIYIFFDGYVCQ